MMIASYVDCPTHGRQEPWEIANEIPIGLAPNRYGAILDAIKRRHPSAYVWVSNAYTLAATDTPILDFTEQGLIRRRFLCGECRYDSQPLPRIKVEVRSPRKGKATPHCGGACLNGKRSCDCLCRGRCHGAGTCSCGNAAA